MRFILRVFWLKTDKAYWNGKWILIQIGKAPKTGWDVGASLFVILGGSNTSFLGHPLSSPHFLGPPPKPRPAARRPLPVSADFPKPSRTSRLPPYLRTMPTNEGSARPVCADDASTMSSFPPPASVSSFPSSSASASPQSVHFPSPSPPTPCTMVSPALLASPPSPSGPPLHRLSPPG